MRLGQQVGGDLNQLGAGLAHLRLDRLALCDLAGVRVNHCLALLAGLLHLGIELPVHLRIRRRQPAPVVRMVDEQRRILPWRWPQHPPDQLAPQPEAGSGPQDLQAGRLRHVEALIDHSTGAEHRDLAAAESLEDPPSLRLRGVTVHRFGGDALVSVPLRHLVGMRNTHRHADGPLTVRVELHPVADDLALDLYHLALHVGGGEVAAALAHAPGVDPMRGGE